MKVHKTAKKIFSDVLDTFRTFRESDFTSLDVSVFGRFNLIPFFNPKRTKFEEGYFMGVTLEPNSNIYLILCNDTQSKWPINLFILLPYYYITDKNMPKYRWKWAKPCYYTGVYPLHQRTHGVLLKVSCNNCNALCIGYEDWQDS